VNSSQFGRLGAVLLLSIKMGWDLTGDVFSDNLFAVAFDSILMLICIAVAIMLYADVVTIDSLFKERAIWRSRATQAESNLLNLGRAVTERLNARAMKPEIDPME
jgi:hypothetical protein